jgi:hypothetical protein
MYDHGGADLDERGRDALARLVVRRYREAVGWAATERVGDAPLREVLARCHDQMHGIPSPAERELALELGNDMRLNITAMKADNLHAFLLDMLSPPDELPWTIGPTPIPDLSEEGRAETLEAVKAHIYSPGFAATVTLEGIREAVRTIKAEVRAKELERADRAAAAMLRLMHDQCVEGGWDRALSAVLRNFVGFPYGIMLGPVPTRGPRMAWAGDRLRVREESFYSFESVSPFDFWFSPDSRSTQDGTCVLVRRRMTRRQLLSMAGLKSYFRDQVEAVLDDVAGADRYNLRWLSDGNPDQPDEQLAFWAQGSATIDALVHYGFLSGRELRETVGLGGLEDRRFYNATVTLVGGRVVQAFVAPDPSVDMRPVHAASFYALSEDRIPGAGVAQKLRDLERAYQAALRCLVSNMGMASAPIAEKDVARLSKYMSLEDIERLGPGMSYLVDNELGLSQNPAVRYFTVPSVMAEYLAVMDRFMDLAHTILNAPALLHGTASGSGANRTWRGASMLQGNAVKVIQSAVRNLDGGIFGPIGEMMYGYNMLYGKDQDMKGDCKVMAQGVSGFLAREMDANGSFDMLQILGVLSNQLGPTVVPAVEWAVKRLLRAWKMPETVVDGMRLGAGGAGPGGGQGGPGGGQGGPPPTDAGMGAPNPAGAGPAPEGAMA